MYWRLLGFVILLAGIVEGLLFCYSCTSGQSGCGSPIDVRLMHWKLCTGRRVIEDFCVKLIEKVADQEIVTRGCLSDLLLYTQHREMMPQVRRQGYCGNAKDYQSYLMSQLKGMTLAEVVMGLFSDQHEDYKRYCFCNDWNGCNHSPSSYRNSKLSYQTTFAILIYKFTSFIF
ncbi:hypothetical protein CSKR_104005 [Clonorchis sinensis]|uniref:Protein quiver n=2 Tax=Clonorchis sinensis TaxID=79923 RepID=A0A8T1M8T9_CLOSI|nr:hypothetical protein CSKR_104005 [Clonorchis sinensis]